MVLVMTMYPFKKQKKKLEDNESLIGGFVQEIISLAGDDDAG